MIHIQYIYETILILMDCFFEFNQFLFAFLEELACPSGYDDFWPDSTHCYWIATEQVTWEDAKVKCNDDGAELACFSDQQERDAVADQCDQCWVGYKWQGGKFYSFSYFVT